MAEKKKVGVAVLGTGGRGRGVVGNLLRDSKGGVEILAAYDPDKAVMSETIGAWNHTGITKECGSTEEAINTVLSALPVSSRQSISSPSRASLKRIIPR